MLKNNVATGVLLASIALSPSSAFATTCTTYPYTFTNGTTADATQVMSNLNYISGCASPIASPSFTGSVGIGTPTPANVLDIGTGGGIHITSGIPGSTTMALYNNSGTLTWNGVALATGSSVSGTTHYIPVFTGASSLGNSAIYQSGSSVGIGTTTPNALLDIGSATSTQGTLRLESGIAGGYSVQIQPSATQTASWSMTLPTAPPATSGYVLSSTTAGVTSWVANGSGGGSSALSSLTSATATNTFDNANFAQTWTWNTLAGGNALSLTSTSTAAASNTQKMLNIGLSGANGTTTQTTYDAYFTNTHTGTLSTNVGLYASASGGTSANYAAIFAAGNVGIGTPTPAALLHVANGAIVDAPSTLTINTSTFTPAAVGSNTYRVVLVHASCPCTIANPSGTAVDGQRFVFEIWQSSTGSDTISTWGSNYDFGTAGTPTLSTGASKGDFLGFSYSAQNAKYNYIGIQQGF